VDIFNVEGREGHSLRMNLLIFSTQAPESITDDLGHRLLKSRQRKSPYIPSPVQSPYCSPLLLVYYCSLVVFDISVHHSEFLALWAL